MRLNVVSCLVEIGVGIDHHGRPVVRAIEDVEKAIGIRLQQHAHAIAFLKNVIRIDAHGQTIRVAHEQSQSEADTRRINRLCR
jgi:hypothetical protein